MYTPGKNYNYGGEMKLIAKYQTPAHGIYLTRPIKPDNAVEQIASGLGIGHAVMGIIDPKTGNIRFSQYGAHGSTADSPVNETIQARFANPDQPTDDEMRELLMQYQRITGDKNPNYTVRYVNGLNYESVIDSMNKNESGVGDFVSKREYHPLGHNCGHYAAGLANSTLEDKRSLHEYLPEPGRTFVRLISKGLGTIPKYQGMPVGTTTYKLNLNKHNGGSR